MQKTERKKCPNCKETIRKNQEYCEIGCEVEYLRCENEQLKESNNNLRRENEIIFSSADKKIKDNEQRFEQLKKKIESLSTRIMEDTTGRQDKMFYVEDVLELLEQVK